MDINNDNNNQNTNNNNNVNNNYDNNNQNNNNNNVNNYYDNNEVKNSDEEMEEYAESFNHDDILHDNNEAHDDKKSKFIQIMKNISEEFAENTIGSIKNIVSKTKEKISNIKNNHDDE